MVTYLISKAVLEAGRLLFSVEMAPTTTNPITNVGSAIQTTEEVEN